VKKRRKVKKHTLKNGNPILKNFPSYHKLTPAPLPAMAGQALVKESG
jgi:hypothetical protein